MDIAAWRQATLSSGAVAPNVTNWPKVQELRSGVSAGAVGHRLTVAENAALEIYDYPGEYAQRFDGFVRVRSRWVGKSPASRSRRVGQS